MAFTSEVVFLKWGSSEYCFYAKQEDYQGGTREKPASYTRSLYDGSLQRVYAPSTLRKWIGIILVEDDRPGTTHNDGTDDISVGKIDDLADAWAATDLQVKSFEDASYWDCEWQGPFVPLVAYDPVRGYADIGAMLVER